MKRLLSILIVLLLCVSVFAGCDTPDSTDDKGQNNNGEQQNIQNDSFEYSAGEKSVPTPQWRRNHC